MEAVIDRRPRRVSEELQLPEIFRHDELISRIVEGSGLEAGLKGLINEGLSLADAQTKRAVIRRISTINKAAKRIYGERGSQDVGNSFFTLLGEGAKAKGGMTADTIRDAAEATIKGLEIRAREKARERPRLEASGPPINYGGGRGMTPKQALEIAGEGIRGAGTAEARKPEDAGREKPREDAVDDSLVHAMVRILRSPMEMGAMKKAVVEAVRTGIGIEEVFRAINRVEAGLSVQKPDATQTVAEENAKAMAAAEFTRGDDFAEGLGVDSDDAPELVSALVSSPEFDALVRDSPGMRPDATAVIIVARMLARKYSLGADDEERKDERSLSE